MDTNERMSAWHFRSVQKSKNSHSSFELGFFCAAIAVGFWRSHWPVVWSFYFKYNNYRIVGVKTLEKETYISCCHLRDLKERKFSKTSYTWKCYTKEYLISFEVMLWLIFRSWSNVVQHWLVTLHCTPQKNPWTPENWKLFLCTCLIFWLSPNSTPCDKGYREKSV